MKSQKWRELLHYIQQINVYAVKLNRMKQILLYV
jgi:hypothetical protein